MTDEHARLIERARGGDWDAIEDLVSGAIAPTFDAALHLFGDAARAGIATEDALLALLEAVRQGDLTDGDPLTVTGKKLASAAAAAGAAPFAGGLTAADMAVIGMRPDDARRSAIAKVAPNDRVAAALAFALDLEPADLGQALGLGAGEAAEAVKRALAAIPHPNPAAALRDVLDGRAAAARVPPDVEEHVLDRYEKG